MEPYASAYNGLKYDSSAHFPGVGFTSINVLPILTGKPFDDIALGYIHGLRPSEIRVSTGTVCLDARTWRVTVYLDSETQLIERICQEIEVGIPEWCRHGHHLHIALQYGKGSEIELWERNEFVSTIHGFDGTYGRLMDGTLIPHPFNEKE